MYNQNKTTGVWSGLGHTGRSFLKMHGLRNHFIIVDGRKQPFNPNIDDIIEICDPKIGIGGDQLLILEPPTESGRKKGAYAFMRIYNIDGREAEACGNATRCIAYLLIEESQREKIILETIADTLECRRAGNMRVSVNMGLVSMDWQKIPIAKECDTCNLKLGNGPLQNPVGLYIGNPHVVFFVQNLDSIDMEKICPAIQNDPLLPNQANIGVAELVNDQHMRLSVFERPGILTESCGSGACVAFYAARIRGLTNAIKMTVELPAGLIEVELQPDNTIVMTGPVAFCFSGHFLTG